MFNFVIENSLEEDSIWYDNEHYLQTLFWANFKSKHGWSFKRFKVNVTTIDSNLSSFSFYITILSRKILKMFSIAYVPMGISLQNVNINNDDYLTLLAEFSKEINKFLDKNTICLRFDPPLDFLTPQERDEFASTISKKTRNLVKKNKVDIQPPDTTILDLSKSEDELLQAMKTKWRYNIHLAEKKGVEILKYTSSDIDIFYDLYLQTSKRDGIAIHSKQYYKDLLELSESNNNNTTPKVCLYVAKHENDYLASIIVLFSKYETVYVYGASSNTKRNLMPAYLLQWNAIKDAKAFGSKIYDFYGMPPTDDENHPMHGLYRFKTGFGGKNIHRVGSLDVSTSAIYNLYKFAESLRSFWFKKIKKMFAGR